jgi:sec-independent protein translocase protein TatA
MFAVVGIPGLIIILVILLILYGPKRVPRTGRALKRAGSEFKNAVTGKQEPLGELPPATVESDAAAARKRDTVG